MQSAACAGLSLCDADGSLIYTEHAGVLQKHLLMLLVRAYASVKIVHAI